ncbi:MAG: tyrosine-type recombinase/integrase [Thermovirgaceae bacterium]
MSRTKKEYQFGSALGPKMDEFRREIENEGRSVTICRHLAQLDRLCIEKNLTSGLLDEETVMAWRQSKEGCCEQEVRQSQSSIRQFAYFLIRGGNHAFVPPATFIRRRTSAAPDFTGCLASWMDSLVAFKRSLGLKYINERKFLHQFDQYLVTVGFSGEVLTREMVDGYAAGLEGDSSKTRVNKLSVVGILARYMAGHGGIAHQGIPSVKVVNMPPYVFSREEIVRFFKTIDGSRFLYPWMAYTVPVYFRLLYTTGMRESECCAILRRDIDYEHGRILVRHAKNNEDRYVYFSRQDAEMLRRCDTVLDQFFPCRDYFFVGGLKGDEPLALVDTTVRNLFKRLWRESGGLHDPKNGHNASVHSFRHTYVVDKLTQWQGEGRDVDSLIPYLSKQLGHASFAETYHYCIRLDTRFAEILDDDQAVIPEVAHG